MKVKNSFAAAEKRIIILLLLIKAVDCGSGEDNGNLCQISYPTICTSHICFFCFIFLIYEKGVQSYYVTLFKVLRGTS